MDKDIGYTLYPLKIAANVIAVMCGCFAAAYLVLTILSLDVFDVFGSVLCPLLTLGLFASVYFLVRYGRSQKIHFDNEGITYHFIRKNITQHLAWDDVVIIYNLNGYKTNITLFATREISLDEFSETFKGKHIEDCGISVNSLSLDFKKLATYIPQNLKTQKVQYNMLTKKCELLYPIVVTKK